MRQDIIYVFFLSRIAKLDHICGFGCCFILTEWEDANCIGNFVNL